MVPHGTFVFRTAPPNPQNFTRHLPLLFCHPPTGRRAKRSLGSPHLQWQPHKVRIRVPASESEVPGYLS